MNPNTRDKTPNPPKFDLSKAWLKHLREASKPGGGCPFCKDSQVFRTYAALLAHVVSAHPEEVPAKENAEEYAKFEEKLRSQAPPIKAEPVRGDTATRPLENLAAGETNVPPFEKTPLTATRLSDLGAELEKVDSSQPEHSEVRDPIAVKRRALGQGPSPSSSVRTTHCDDSNALVTKGSPLRNPHIVRKRQVSPWRPSNEPDVREQPGIVRQPETRPISQEQLIAEVKGIYAGLVMVEAKCIQVDAKQAALTQEVPQGTQLELNNEQWQALIALHRTLLHEHHDFFLASQHPTATPAVRRLAIKYAMPARLWRHGIHSFLELLRNRLPASLDHMLAFIYLAYSMMTLLFETVPAFEETWIECLGDLGRYRMAIEDDDIRDREVWTQVSRQWYLKALYRTHSVGRLYHHLAILARPNALQQLFFYGKALLVSQPFPAAKKSALTLFEPIRSGRQTRRLPPVITAYVKINGFIWIRNDTDSFYKGLAEFISLLDGHISRVTQRFLEQGYYIGISNCFALLSYGSPDGLLSKALSISDVEPMASANIPAKDYTGSPAETTLFKEALQLFVQTLEVNSKRVGDPNILSFLHVVLVFLVYVSQFPAAMQLLENEIHWEPLLSMLNSLLRFYHFHSRIEGDQLPIPEKNDFRPTPEEFAMRGLDWAAFYFPAGWFENKNIEEENQYKEDASMNTDYRPERILWLGCRLAKSGKWIRYENQKFMMPSAATTVHSLTEPAPPSELKLDSGDESEAESATLNGDADDAMSIASRSSAGLSEKARKARLAFQTSSTYMSELEEGGGGGEGSMVDGFHGTEEEIKVEEMKVEEMK